jgi:hypothetical protein
LTSLHRFAAQRWTPRDVELAVIDVLAQRQWRVPDQLRRPEAYLAVLLRDVDPAERPTVIEAAMLAQERERRAWIDRTAYGQPECAHGLAGGDIPHPVDGHFACLECRVRKQKREARSTTNKPP